jgi:glycosyltransferase involved in cell wall biosynthesis
MKILQIDVALNVGSTGKIAENIGEMIIKNGGESYIAYGRDARTSASKSVKIGNKFDQAYHLLMTRLFDQHALHSKNATRKFIKEIEIIDPDIIHLHQIHGYYLNIKELLTFLKKFNRPIVWTFHDCWQFTGHCSYYTRVDCDKWKTECHSCPLIKLYPSSLGWDNSRKNYNIKRNHITPLDNLTIIPVSNWLKSELKQSFLKDMKIKTICNGVDINIFKPSDGNYLKNKYGLTNKKVWLGVAAYWSGQKGLNDFIELAKLTSEDIQIVLIGLTIAELEKIPKNILGLKSTENINELRDFYSMANVFLNPSIAESFGLVTVEAMACGTPVVVYNSTASPELVSIETGIIVKRNDIIGLYDAAIEITNMGKIKYSKNCIERASTYFNRDKQIKLYIDLYKVLIKYSN